MTRDRKPPARISLVLADVDGTLVTKDKLLTERAQRAVHALHDRGIRFAITSGRPPKGMAMLIGPLKLEGVIAGFNGGQFVEPDLNIIEEHTLPAEAAHNSVKLMLDQGLDVWVYSGGDWMIRDAKAAHVDREEKTVQFAPKVVSSISDAMLERAVKIVGVSDDLELVAQAEHKAQETLGRTASANRSQPYYLDVTNAKANKGDVVLYLAGRYSIDPVEIVTLGDMPNDTLMFRKSGFAIAMGQSSKDVQDEADVATTSYEDEGFARAIEQHVLGEKRP